MEIKNVVDAGGEILDVVMDAVNRNDFAGLSENVRGTVNRTIQQLRQDGQQNAADGYRNPVEGGQNAADGYRNPVGRQYQFKGRGTAAGQGRSTDLPATITSSPKGRILGPLQLGGGILATALFCITAVVMEILLLVRGGTAFLVLAVVFGALTGYSISHIIRGKSKIGLVNRFYRYARLIGGRSYIAIEELVRQTGNKREDVLKDLKRMTQRNMFPQGRLDDKETTFMLTREVYDQYLQLEETRRTQEQQAREEAAEASGSEETRRILEEGNDYIRMVRRCNDDIQDVSMSDKLDRLERIMRKIFDQVKRQPESAESLHKFMTYYLPTTKKLLDAYIDLDRQEISGENIRSTKQEIEETLDTINEAFERLLDDMFEDTAWDISSDISVMKTMMAQEGLTGGRDFG